MAPTVIHLRGCIRKNQLSKISPYAEIMERFPLLYSIKLVVNSSPVCADSVEFPITVYQNAIADFTVNPTCINLPVIATNKTIDTMGSRINYLWDFGNGQTSTQ